MRVNFFLFFYFLVFSTLKATESISGLSYLNSIRTEAGLRSFFPSDALTRASTAHANYLTTHQINGHYEKKGKKGYTGNTPTDRAISANYHSTLVMENISVNGENSHIAIDNLMSAIYHRFTFLTTDKDEIGEGLSKRSKNSRISTAYVYTLGFSELEEICKQYFMIQPGIKSIKNICKDRNKVIPETLYLNKLNVLKRKNTPVIIYPYKSQKNVSPVFYIENPHPLPGSKVSGFPISIEFNDTYAQYVKLKSFQLFNSQGIEIKKYKILTYKNDIHHRLTRFQFAFMPLKRLEYAETYYAVVRATVNSKKIEKKWSFTTIKPKDSLYKITNKVTTLNVKKGTKILLYFEPKSKKDVLKNISFKGNLKIQYLDQNTLEVILPNKISKTLYSVDEVTRKVILKIQ